MKPLKLLLSIVVVLGSLMTTTKPCTATLPQTSRTDSGGGVTVKVTALDTKGSGDFRFQVALDTHSVNLDGYDFKAITLLRDDSGNNYLPTSVENKGSGH